MKFTAGSIVSLVLVLMATSSLISMISTLKIDAIVHGDLYRYGLQFSYGWALPYWTMTTLVFAMGWFNIIAAVAFQFYVLIYGRKEALGTEVSKEPETKPTEKIEEYEEQAVEPVEEAEREPKETQTVVEDTSQPEQTETIPAEEAEEQKEQEPKTAEESEVETKETSTPARETEQETQEKSEETPFLVGVPEEEPQAATEDTPQQVGAG